jgi:DNA repair exonuclease SbcCD ATPase subunit
MQAQRIDAVVASNFRGATTRTEVLFDPKKKMSLLFGENGTGKSTIVDAIDAVCNQSLGSLEDRGAASGGHVASIGAKPADVKVSVRSGEKTWTATLRGTKFSVVPQDSPPRATILRRGQILGLVTAQPAKRYEQLKAFIDVEGVEKSESALKKAIKDAKAASDDAESRMKGAREHLEQACQADQTPDEEAVPVLEWARKRTSADLAALRKRLRGYDAVLSGNNRIQILRDLSQKTQEESKTKKQELRSIEEKKSAPLLVNVDTGIALASLLEKARDYLSTAKNVEKCPVCLRPSAASDLEAAISDQLAQCSALRALANEIDTATRDYNDARGQTARAYSDLVEAIVAVQPCLADLDEADLVALAPLLSDYPRLAAWDRKLDAKAVEEVTRYTSFLPPLVEKTLAKREALNKQVDQLGAIRRDLDLYIDSQATASRKKAVGKTLEAMHSCVHDLRVQFTQEILDHVADDCDRLYVRVHPDEGLGGVRFVMDEAKRSSLEQVGSFSGHDNIRPEAYFSDSHLDTLGFCFFLAVTKHITNGKTVVVLDDVFASVDLTHIGRILPLLIEESEHYEQLIFATHQRRWLEMLRDGVAPADQVDVIQLRPWCVEEGIRAENPTR